MIFSNCSDSLFRFQDIYFVAKTKIKLLLRIYTSNDDDICRHYNQFVLFKSLILIFLIIKHDNY